MAKLFLDIGLRVIVLNRRGAHFKTITRREKIKRHGFFQGIEYFYCSLIPYKSANFLIRNSTKLIGYINEFFAVFYNVYFNDAKYIICNTIHLNDLKYYWLLSRIFKMELIYDYVEYIDSLGDRDKKEIIEVNKSFDNNFYRNTDKLIFISDFLMNHLKTQSYNKPIFKIPPIIDFSFFDNIGIKRKDFSYFLFCGSAAYYDIIIFIINSFLSSESIEKNHKLKLVINGSSNELLKINEFINNHNSNENIIILSNLSYIDLITYYKSSMALLIPISDNLQDQARFPFKICEYTASKRPIITSDTGPIKEYFKDNINALIAKTGDYKSFAQKMNLVINKPTFANKIGMNGYELGKKVFSYKEYTEEFKEFVLKSN